MKRTIVILFAAILGPSAGFAQEGEKITLKDAIQNGYIKADISSKTGELTRSSYYGPCVNMNLENLTDKELIILVEPGRRLAPFNKNVQTLIVTEPLFVKVKGKSKATETVYAMCGQAHDGAPSIGEPFAVGKMSNSYVTSLAEFIGEHDYHNFTGQNAMWCMTDDYDISLIQGEDSKMVELLSGFVGETKNKMNSAASIPDVDPFIPEYMRPCKTSASQQMEENFIPEFMRPGRSVKAPAEEIPEFMRPGHINRPENETAPTLEHPAGSTMVYTLSGSFTVGLKSSEDVRLVVVNEAGEELRDIATYSAPSIATHKYSYKVQDSIFHGIVYVRMIQAGNQLAEMKFVLK